MEDKDTKSVGLSLGERRKLQQKETKKKLADERRKLKQFEEEERASKEREERERIRLEKLEAEKLEREKLDKLAKEILEEERVAKVKLERLKLERERIELEKLNRPGPSSQVEDIIEEVGENLFDATKEDEGINLAVARKSLEKALEDIEEARFGKSLVPDSSDEIEGEDELVRRTLEVQENIIEITLDKDCKRNIGRKFREETRAMMDIIYKQHKLIGFLKGQLQELRKNDDELKVTYADKVKMGQQIRKDERSRSRSRGKVVHSVTVYPVGDKSSQETHQILTKKVDVKN